MITLLRKVLMYTLVIFLNSIFLMGCGTSPSSEKASAQLSMELLQVETRPGVKQSFVLISPENPIATVIFLRGGKGLFQLKGTSGKITAGQGKKLFEILSAFAMKGFVVVVVDTPSDKPNGIDPFFRAGKEHARDIETVVSYSSEKINLPIWLFGHSFGTISAANGAIRAQLEIDGLVLASPATRMIKDWGEIYDSNPNGIIDMDLDKIQVPTLLIYHRIDKCIGAPPSNISRLKDKIKKAKTIELTGGKTQKSKPCGPLAAHSFFGIEKQFFSAVTEFIKSN